MTNGKLRRELMEQEAADENPDSTESLPEAMTVARDPEPGSSGGSEHMAGEEAYVESSATAADLIPQDPPLGGGTAGQGGE